jgi:hypothetical protein
LILSEWVLGGLSFLLTIMVLSYLIGDNVFFRLASYLFVGVTAGYVTVLILQQILWPYLVFPLFFGTWINRLWIALPLVLILLLVIGQFPKFRSLAAIPLAFLAGLIAALVIAGAVFGTLLPQSQAVISRFSPEIRQSAREGAWLPIIEAVFMFIGTIGTLSYFFFQRRRQHELDDATGSQDQIFEKIGLVGQVFIGIALGVIYAGVFSSALLALIDRLIFIQSFIIKLLGAG